jgi:hypothetical protein
MVSELILTQAPCTERGKINYGYSPCTFNSFFILFYEIHGPNLPGKVEERGRREKE